MADAARRRRRPTDPRARAARLLRLFCLLPALCAVPALGGQATIAVAANFTGPMQAIAEAYQRESGHELHLSFGSSGKLFAQIQNGAPFDAFLSADTAKTAALVEAGAAVAASRFTYAVGALALWSGTPGADARTMLERGDYRRLAIANPRLAPYGVAAVETLERSGCLAQASSRLVLGENVTQAWQFVATGNVELGFVALAQVVAAGRPPAGVWVVPNELYQPIRQDAVLLSRGEHNGAATGLLAFLRGARAAAIMRDFGYRAAPPDTASAPVRRPPRQCTLPPLT